jgi:hypothetical protein
MAYISKVFNDCVKMCNDVQLPDYTPQQACKHVGRDIDNTLFVTTIAVRTPLPVTEPPHVSRTFGFCGPPGMFCSFEDDKVVEDAVAMPMSPTSTGDAYAKVSDHPSKMFFIYPFLQH